MECNILNYADTDTEVKIIKQIEEDQKDELFVPNRNTKEYLKLTDTETVKALSVKLNF